MKLSLLEDGVLDYKGDGLTLAVPNAVAAGSIGAGVKPAPIDLFREEFEEHIEECPQCSMGRLCDIGKLLSGRS